MRLSHWVNSVSINGPPICRMASNLERLSWEWGVSFIVNRLCFAIHIDRAWLDALDTAPMHIRGYTEFGVSVFGAVSFGVEYVT